MGEPVNDSYISRNGLVVAVSWMAVAACMVGAWVTALVSPNVWIIAAVLAATGCVLTGVAVVAHMRCYSARLCSLVRVTAGLEAPDDAQVTRLR